MQVTRFKDAEAYAAGGHFAMTAMLLQGRDVTPCKDFWVGFSTFLPGGGADWSSSDTSKVYVVLEGTLTIKNSEGEFDLGPNDSLYLAPGDERSLVNNTNHPAKMLVVSS